MKMAPEGDQAVIHAVLHRKSSFSRKAVMSGGMPETGGKTDQQVLATNIDTVFLVSGLDSDFNVRRIERYLSVAWDSGAAPVIVLNKADLHEDLEKFTSEVESSAIGVPLCITSASQGIGLDQIRNLIKPGKTAVFLGSSGVGKSTLINALLGEDRLRTTEVRADDSRGRHTTTHRELVVLPQGGMVIDTPGLREIQLWQENSGLEKSFADIEALIGNCRFSDCRHETEPGCAVKEAIENGELDEKRYANYLKLKKEQRFLATRKDQKLSRETDRQFSKMIRRHLQDQKKLKDNGLI
jgi:ribosome biogenesis GTPase